MSVTARVQGERLEVMLPQDLGTSNRQQLIEVVESSLAPGIRGVRLDAAALRYVDSAGLGALARVLRMCIDATGAPPQLANAGDEVRESLRAVLLLQHFDLTGA